mmetsp:Transcript_48139/g.92012  ORF Transcript_48139/g.92012 Transcript_48139/m.92012 type:complete len:208 (-) Transcript_48139:34-657(-)
MIEDTMTTMTVRGRRKNPSLGRKITFTPTSRMLNIWEVTDSPVVSSASKAAVNPTIAVRPLITSDAIPPLNTDRAFDTISVSPRGAPYATLPSAGSIACPDASDPEEDDTTGSAAISASAVAAECSAATNFFGEETVGAETEGSASLEEARTIIEPRARGCRCDVIVEAFPDTRDGRVSTDVAMVLIARAIISWRMMLSKNARRWCA